MSVRLKGFILSSDIQEMSHLLDEAKKLFIARSVFLVKNTAEPQTTS